MSLPLPSPWICAINTNLPNQHHIPETDIDRDSTWTHMSRNSIVETSTSNTQMTQMGNSETDIHEFTSDYVVYAWSNVTCNNNVLRPIWHRLKYLLEMVIAGGSTCRSSPVKKQ